jgi:hypothetical protein
VDGCAVEYIDDVILFLESDKPMTNTDRHEVVIRSLVITATFESLVYQANSVGIQVPTSVYIDGSETEKICLRTICHDKNV